MPSVTRILVPVDFSECSRQALLHAVALGAKLGAKIHVLHVWEPPLYIFPEVMVQVPDEPAQSLGDFAQQRAGREMDQFLREALGEDRPDITRDVQTGHPYQAILRALDDEPYDLIVMGTHGRRGLPHLLLGSIAEKVVRHAPCAVMTIRAEDPQ